MDSNKLEAQIRFDTAVRCACSLLQEDVLLQHATGHVSSLQLQRALPYNFRLPKLLNKLTNLQEVDVSGNQMGPQGFRLLMLALAHNTSITRMNVSNNMTDTDSADSVGEMLKLNNTLLYLDVSGNYLGKDYFSRCVGPALKTNNSLVVLKCESIGSTDLTVLLENLTHNETLQELNISHNQLSQPDLPVQHLCTIIQKSAIRCLDMKNCGLEDQHIYALTVAISRNHSLNHLNMASNAVSTHKTMLHLLLTCMSHSSLTSLILDDTRIREPGPLEIGSLSFTGSASTLETLSIGNCNISDSHMEALQSALCGITLRLGDLNLSNNINLTTKGIISLVTLCQSSLKRLNIGMTNCQDIFSIKKNCQDLKLTYLNLRKSKVKMDHMKDLLGLYDRANPSTLVLDGIKLAGTAMTHLKQLLCNFSNLSALSVGSCSLADEDLQHLCDIIKSPGISLQMLKLSANRITDKGVAALVDGLLFHASHDLRLVDLSNNQITGIGAKKLSELFRHPLHKSSIHSLNLSCNNIDSAGLMSLVPLIGQTPVTCLHLHKQTATYEEEDVEEICMAAANVLGAKVTIEDDEVIAGYSSLDREPPAGVLVKLTGLGADIGVGRHIDSSAITTDLNLKRLPYLPLHQVAELSAFLMHKESCDISSSEWDNIINGNKEFPQWLKKTLEKTVYLSHLPASVTVPKMEGLFENEIDCNVTEVYLLKDPITRSNNGFAWALLNSKDDVQKAMDYMNRGEAQVFSQPYLLSSLNLNINMNGVSSNASVALEEIEDRKTRRAKEEADHRALLRQSYLESQERHGYRLAHPAYADGRIW